MRRHLGYTPAEVDAMPWWEIRMWAEKLMEEFGEASEADESDVPRAREESSLDELAGYGMNVRKVT